MAQCTATAKATGEQCQREAGESRVCVKHGGGAPQVKQAVARRVVEAKITKAIRGTAMREITNPLEELLQITSEVVAFKDHLAGLIENLSQLSSTDAKGMEQVHALVGAYERALDRSGTWLATVAKLNIDERMARISETQTMMVVRAFEAGMAAVGVAGPQAHTAKQAMAAQLRIAA